MIKDEPLCQAELDTAIRLLRRCIDQYPEEDYSSFAIPNMKGCMQYVQDIARASILDYAARQHSNISSDIARLLKMPTNSDINLAALNDFDKFDYSQEQQRTTVIQDCLDSYLVNSTFSEYLANAEDSKKATQVTWLLDIVNFRENQTETLITPALNVFQGNALFCWNDGGKKIFHLRCAYDSVANNYFRPILVFSSKDFEGLIDIGKGSKKDDTSSIGKYGKGALTMYVKLKLCPRGRRQITILTLCQGTTGPAFLN